MWLGLETKPNWVSLTHSPLGSDRLRRASLPVCVRFQTSLPHPSFRGPRLVGCLAGVDPRHSLIRSTYLALNTLLILPLTISQRLIAARSNFVPVSRRFHTTCLLLKYCIG